MCIRDRVYSGGIEAAFTKYPVLEPSFLYGGYPCKDLRHKFLMAQESSVTDFSDESFPKEIEVIPLPGHFFDMVGFRMPDGVVFLADCISSRETLDKYAVCLLYTSASDDWFSHLAIEVPGVDCSNEWCEAVSEEEYAGLI